MRIADELQVDCPVFYIDNVAEYFGAAHPAGSSGVLVDDLPQLMPPFPDMWMEYFRIREGVPPFRIGIRIRTRKVDGGHVIQIDGFESAPIAGDRVHKSPTSLFVVLSDDLRLVAAMDGLHQDDPRSFDKWWVAKGCKPGQGCRLITPMFLAISFMHCKNVRHVENEPTGQRARRRQGKPPLVKFYTLEIDPMKETLRREGNVETVGLAKALHICRGHFKDYRASGLFGKIKGIFWWGPALRGTPEAGQVVKDYAVKAPTPPETVH